MPLHCSLQVFNRRAGGQIQHLIEAVRPEEISMGLSGRRAGPGVSCLSEAVDALDCRKGLIDGGIFSDPLSDGINRRNIPDQPVIECARRRIRVLEDKGKAGRGESPNPNFGRGIAPVAGMVPGKLSNPNCRVILAIASASSESMDDSFSPAMEPGMSKKMITAAKDTELVMFMPSINLVLRCSEWV